MLEINVECVNLFFHPSPTRGSMHHSDVRLEVTFLVAHIGTIGAGEVQTLLCSILSGVGQSNVVGEVTFQISNIITFSAGKLFTSYYASIHSTIHYSCFLDDRKFLLLYVSFFGILIFDFVIFHGYL